LSGNPHAVSQLEIFGKRDLKISGCSANLHVEIPTDRRILGLTLMEVNKYKAMINGIEGLNVQTLKRWKMDIPGMPDFNQVVTIIQVDKRLKWTKLSIIIRRVQTKLRPSKAG
jgi:hypothetical protein